MQVKPEDLDHTSISGGKYRSMTPSAIAEIDPWYVVNVLAGWKPKVCSDALIADCKKDLDKAVRGRHED